MEPTVEKVTAFVTRESPAGTELLLFEHPSAGVELPAGTVEEGEPHAAAAAREAWEETGLADLPPGRLLAALQVKLPEEHYLVASTTSVYGRPEAGSFDWASIRNGLMVQRHRTEGGYAHVTFTEWYRRAEPPYVTYQITGWAPLAALPPIIASQRPWVDVLLQATI